MNKNALYIILIFFNSCNFVQKRETDNRSEIDSVVEMQSHTIIFDSIKCGLNFNKGMNYKNSKNKMARLKLRLHKDYIEIKDSIEKEIFLDSIMSLFSTKLLKDESLFCEKWSTLCNIAS